MKNVLLLTVCFAAFLTSGVEIGFANGPRKGWSFSAGREFPGAKGSFSVEKGLGIQGGFAARLTGDFSAGGLYTAIVYAPYKRFDFKCLKVTVRNTGKLKAFSVRLIDETNQTHQQDVPLEPDTEKWQTVMIQPREGRKNFWGGAADGKWHGKFRGLSLVCPVKSFPDGVKKAELLFQKIEVVEK